MRQSFRHLPVFLLLSLLLSNTTGFAQKEANTWYFGRYMGLDFNSGAPIALNNGQLNTTEGVATISNSNGNLLFYTDGITIWNRLHQLMLNGSGLMGNPSSTQSAIVVPVIGDTLRYYVFTVAQLSGPDGLRYSIVNMSLDNGNGGVEVKNLPLQSNVVEKITAVKHCNNRDIWVVCHGSVSDIYYSFLVTAAGISTTPVISHTGVVLPGVVLPASYDSSSLGYLKASPDGKRLAAAHWTVNADVSDFDNATGLVSNTVSLFQPGDPHYLAYGIDFSPNSKLLYTTVFYTDPVNAQKRNALYQYDITLATPAAIRASRQITSLNSDPIQTYAALQVAPDGKMYMAKNTYKHLASINNPDVYGPGCNYTSNAIQFSLPNQSSSFGLPTFVQSYFYPADSFSYIRNCPGTTVNFNYTVTSGTSSIQWNFGDPVSGVNNTSLLNNPSHTFTTPGIYNVQLIKFTSCGPDTIRRQIQTDALHIDLGADTLVCGGTSILLNSSAAGSGNTFLWQDGSTDPTFSTTTSGLYWVQVSNALGCSKRDSINVTFKPSPVFNLGNDTAICERDTLTLNATVANATSYLWHNGNTTSTLRAYQAGTYWCEVNKDGCVFRDSLIILSVSPAPLVNLGTDSTLCGNNTLTLNATNANSTYIWQNGSTDPIFSPVVTGLYWVNVTNNSGCSKRDSVNIYFKPIPVFNLGQDTSICVKDTLILNASFSQATSYLWNTGSISQSISAFLPGIYWCEAEKEGCYFRDSLSIISLKPLPVIDLGNDTSLCEGNTLHLDASYLNATYLWQNGQTGSSYTVSMQGTYRVRVTYDGCIKYDTIKVNYNPKPSFTLGPDQYICNGNPVILAPVTSLSWSLTWQDGSSVTTYTVNQPGTYFLTATNHCGLATDEITISKGLCNVYIPNAFTPNDDGRNDVFRVSGTEAVTEFNMRIFNRYGQIVFETTDKLKGWDGKLKGLPSPMGVYVYILSYKEHNAAANVIKGTITVIR